MFQTLDIEILCPKLIIHLTKSPKHDHIYKLYKLCLYMLERYMLNIIILHVIFSKPEI